MEDFDNFLEDDLDILEIIFHGSRTQGLAVFMNWMNLNFIRGSGSQKQVLYIF
jgi:hypothetical protein